MLLKELNVGKCVNSVDCNALSFFTPSNILTDLNLTESKTKSKIKSPLT